MPVAAVRCRGAYNIDVRSVRGRRGPRSSTGGDPHDPDCRSEHRGDGGGGAEPVPRGTRAGARRMDCVAARGGTTHVRGRVHAGARAAGRAVRRAAAPAGRLDRRRRPGEPRAVARAPRLLHTGRRPRGINFWSAMLTRREMLFGAAAAAAAAARTQTPRPPVSFLMPPGATDCHAHVFCDAKAFPMSGARTYTPEPASVAELITHHRALTLERVVLIQPSVYGTDNDCLLAAMRELGFRARGIAVIDDKTPDAAVDGMIRAGVRGIRINLETTGQADPAVARERFQAAVKRIGARKLHIQIFARLSV